MARMPRLLGTDIPLRHVDQAFDASAHHLSNTLHDIRHRRLGCVPIHGRLYGCGKSGRGRCRGVRSDAGTVTLTEGPRCWGCLQIHRGQQTRQRAC